VRSQSSGKRLENLTARAESLNSYRFNLGEADSFARDLARWTSISGEDVRRWAGKVLDEGRLDLRILPLDAAIEGADLDRRPTDYPPADYRAAAPERIVLSNGIPVDLVSRPGSGLFQGALLVSHLVDQPFSYFQLDPDEFMARARVVRNTVETDPGAPTLTEVREMMEEVEAEIAAEKEGLATTPREGG